MAVTNKMVRIVVGLFLILIASYLFYAAYAKPYPDIIHYFFPVLIGLIGLHMLLTIKKTENLRLSDKEIHHRLLVHSKYGIIAIIIITLGLAYLGFFLPVVGGYHGGNTFIEEVLDIWFDMLKFLFPLLFLALILTIIPLIKLKSLKK